MEFNLDDFVAHPSLDKLHSCTKEHLIVIADHYCVTVPKQAKKQVLKSELLNALSDKGVLPSTPSMSTVSSPSGHQDPGEQFRLKELEVEMRRLAIKKGNLMLK